MARSYVRTPDICTLVEGQKPLLIDAEDRNTIGILNSFSSVTALLIYHCCNQDVIARTSSAILSTCRHHSYFLAFSLSIGRILGNFSVSVSSLYLQMLALRCQVYAYQVEHEVFL